MWWSKVVNRSCLLLRALSRTPCNPWDILFPSCAGRMLGSTEFSLVTGRPSTTSAAGVSAHFVRRLRWYHAHVRLLAGVPARIALLASRTGPAADKPRMPARSLGSRACSFSTCVWLLDYAGPGSSSRLRSRQCGLPVASTRSAPQIAFFEARFLARRCLCLHFTRYLAAPSARLEVKMVRYSFLVGNFHPRLHAGLSRRLRLLTRAAPLTEVPCRRRHRWGL